MSVLIVCGINEGHFNVAGRTVADVRRSLATPLNIASTAKAYLNNGPAGGRRLLREGDKLEFFRPGGQKGATLAMIGPLRVIIYPDEHPPPHFCVEYQGHGASFAIEDCGRLPGNKGLERFEKRIRNWWRGNRPVLIEWWNKLRPSGCPVGRFRV